MNSEKKSNFRPSYTGSYIRKRTMMNGLFTRCIGPVMPKEKLVLQVKCVLVSLVLVAMQISC